jgi:tetratricopeptide (TPR) repeat protein
LGAWFFLVLAPSSSIMPLTGAIVGDHRMYLPLVAPVAFAAFAAWVGLDAWGRAGGLSARGRDAIAIGLTLLVAVTLGTLTLRRNRDFRDETILWSDALAKSPGNPRAHNNLGSALVRQGKLDAAMEHFEEALRLRPNDCEARFNVGLVLLRQKHYDAAIESLRQAIQLDPRLTEAHHNLGLALLAKNDYEAAIAAFRAAMARNPEHAGAHNNLAWILATCPEPRWRDGPQAVREAEEAMRLVHREDPEMLDTLAAAHAAAGQFETAVATVDRALAQPVPAGRPDLPGKLRDRQALYRSGQPYRMPAPTP